MSKYCLAFVITVNVAPWFRTRSTHNCLFHHLKATRIGRIHYYAIECNHSRQFDCDEDRVVCIAMKTELRAFVILYRFCSLFLSDASDIFHFAEIRLEMICSGEYKRVNSLISSANCTERSAMKWNKNYGNINNMDRLKIPHDGGWRSRTTTKKSIQFLLLPNCTDARLQGWPFSNWNSRRTTTVW